MEQAPELLANAAAAVLTPGLDSFLWLLGVSLVGEAVIQLPTSILFASPLLFLEEPWSAAFFLKLLSLVAFPVGVGTAIGSLLPYSVAYWGGKPAIERFKKFLRFSWQDVERLEAKFRGKSYDELAFLAWRCLPLTPTLPLNLLAGIVRMNPARYLLLTVLGTTIRMMLMLLIFGAGGGAALIDILDL